VRVIIEAGGYEQEYVLREGVTVIGREPSCDIRFADPSLSRRHLECALQQGELIVRDLNSRNGTYLGSQRIEEAHIRPGFCLRAGAVRIRFEEEDIPAAQASAPLAEPNVPEDENFEEDEEPTPLDDSVVQSAAGDSGSGVMQLIVRGDHWFVQDTLSGVEVEIVPRHSGGGPAEAPPGARQPPSPAAAVEQRDRLPNGLPVAQAGLPARLPRGATPARVSSARTATAAEPEGLGLRLLLAVRSRLKPVLVAAAVLSLLLTAGIIWLTPPKGPEPITSARYRALVNEAVADFNNGSRSEAVAKLNHLRTRPVQGRQQLAEILLAAFAADDQARADFRKESKKAKQCWQEVRESPESTEPARELASARLYWISNETENMFHLRDARKRLKEGKLAECLELALRVSEDSLFWEEAEPLIATTRETVIKTTEARAAEAEATRNWSEAIAQYREIKKYQPDRTAEIDVRIARLTQHQHDQDVLEQARNLASAGRHQEAIRHLAGIAQDSPYADDAATLKLECDSQGAVRRAGNAYDQGEGKRALEILAAAGLSDSDLHHKIQAVLTRRENADEAFADLEFDQARKELEAIVQLESAETNRYARNAQAELDTLDQLRANAGRKLLDEAEAAVRERKFVLAREKYYKVLTFDPAKRPAVFKALDDLRRDARQDFNVAVNILKRRDPEKAIKVLQEVKDRVEADDDLQQLAENEILKIRLEQNNKNQQESE